LDLLRGIWSQRGQIIHTLLIEASWANLEDFLDFCPPVHPHLERLSLDFLLFQITYPSSNSATLCCKIIAFIKSHRGTPETLILLRPTSFSPGDLSTLIRGLGFLPKLKKGQIPTVLPPSSLSQLKYLQRFLALHVATNTSIYASDTHTFSRRIFMKSSNSSSMMSSQFLNYQCFMNLP
jgi:hypothetical protein